MKKSSSVFMRLTTCTFPQNHFRGVRIPVIFEEEVNFTIQVLQLQLALYTQTTPFSFWYSVKT